MEKIAEKIIEIPENNSENKKIETKPEPAAQDTGQGDISELPQVSLDFQERLFHNFPQYRGIVSKTHIQQLYLLANTITLKKDSASAWKAIESNPFLGMYFRYQMDKILSLKEQKTGVRSFFFSSMLFILGAIWSWIVQEIDTTTMNWFSLFLLGLGPLGQKIRQKILYTLKIKKNLAEQMGASNGSRDA